ncbi:MAG: hypothetical protein WBA68_08665 [Alteraurantiacibacter sp.]
MNFGGNRGNVRRAPNISELFSPQQGTVFRSPNPCDASQIGVLDAADVAVRQANRVAAFQALGADPSDVVHEQTQLNFGRIGTAGIEDR